MAAAIFLEVKGWAFHETAVEGVLQLLSLAAEEITVDGYAVWLGNSCSTV